MPNGLLATDTIDWILYHRPTDDGQGREGAFDRTHRTPHWLRACISAAFFQSQCGAKTY